MAIDFGDAPDTGPGTGIGNYQTLLADNGPRHDITATQTSLFLGARVDGEADATQDTRANGDNITTLPNDEDGVVEPAQDLLLTVGMAPVVRLHATNTTGDAATLYGWIDYNHDGVFDNAAERTSIVVPVGTTNGTFRLTLPTIPLTVAAGPTYARFRLSSDAAAANPTGLAVGGEVEDYPAYITHRSDLSADSAKTTKIASNTSGGPALAAGDEFGRAVASLGDLDGNGVPDLAVGAAYDGTGGVNRGAVYVEFMNADGTVKSSQKIASGIGGGPNLANGDHFGEGLASIGDLDGDGVLDLLAGAIGDDTGGSDRGAAYVLFMNANGTVKSSVKIASGVDGGPSLANNDYFGVSATTLGDLDGDGVTDLAVSAIYDDSGGADRGAVYVLFMNANGTVKTSSKIASATNGGPSLVDFGLFGRSMASLGDLDGDGVTDLAVGAARDSTGGEFRGTLYVLFLNANGSVKSSVKIANNLNGAPVLADGDVFGRSAASIGDVDGDGIADLAVGADSTDLGGTNRGVIYVLLMSPNGTVKRSIEFGDNLNGGPSLSDNDFFGDSVAALGDLDGDGVTELAVGALGDGTEGVNAGAVHVLFLNPLRDFGDAPDPGPGTGIGNYQTLLADNGPRHDISTTQNTLFLGAHVDAETDATPNFNAHGDDQFTAGGSDDEDGVIEPAQDLQLTIGAAPTIRLRATNTTGNIATLYGWIDYNRDGVFDNATERTSIAVPNAISNGTFTLVFPTIPSNIAAGATYARFRLSSDVAASNPTGLAVGGEVEDYLASIALQSGGTGDSSKTKKIADNTNGGPSLDNSDLFGRSIAPVGDINGDGVTDLAISATRNNTGGADRGAVYVQFMNANGTVKNSVKIASGMNGGPTLENGDRFGISIAALGDLDGDGVNDLAVGARYDDTGGADRGAVYVLFLQADGTVKSNIKIASDTGGGPALANGDNFGYALASVGDLDGDGVTDLAVSADFDDTGGADCGAVYILYLNANGTAKSSVKIANGVSGGPSLTPGDRFGSSITSLGDLDADGVTDLAVGALLDDTAGSDRGAVHVLFLNADGTVKRSVKIASGTSGGPTLANDDYFGYAIASIGDLDGDGATELAVGAADADTGGTNRGSVYVLSLNRNGTAKTFIKIASGVGSGPALANGDEFGSSLASLGDFDGDGVPDLAVGAIRDDTGGTDRGAVYLMFLSKPNHAPTFVNGKKESATDEDPSQNVTAWATDILAGPPEESGQTLYFVVSNDNNGLFMDQPAIDPNGNLMFTPKPNAHGTAVVTVMLKDDGGTLSGGVDISDSHQFNITVTKQHRLFNAAESGARRGLDVTGSTSTAPDGFIVAQDVIAVINYINSKGSGKIPDNVPYGPPYVDVTGDDQVVAEDVIKIINYINAHPGQSEAEATTLSQPASNNLPSDLISLLSLDIAEQAARRRRLQ